MLFLIPTWPNYKSLFYLTLFWSCSNSLFLFPSSQLHLNTPDITKEWPGLLWASDWIRHLAKNHTIPQCSYLVEMTAASSIMAVRLDRKSISKKAETNENKIRDWQMKGVPFSRKLTTPPCYSMKRSGKNISKISS